MLGSHVVVFVDVFSQVVEVGNPFFTTIFQSPMRRPIWSVSWNSQ